MSIHVNFLELFETAFLFGTLMCMLYVALIGWWNVQVNMRSSYNPNLTTTCIPQLASQDRPSFAMVSHTKGMQPASHASCRQQSPSHLMALGPIKKYTILKGGRVGQIANS